MDQLALEEQCTNSPPGFAATRKREVETSINQTWAHERDIKGRQSTGGFLDANIYKFMGCDGGKSSSTTDGEGVDPCGDNSNPCPNVFSRYPTTNGGSPTQIALPPAGDGYSTGPITNLPTTTSTTTSTTAPTPPTLTDHFTFVAYSLLCAVYQGAPDPDANTNICNRDDYQHEDDWFVKDGNVIDGDPPKELDGINTFDNNGCDFTLDLFINEYNDAAEGAHVGTLKCLDKAIDCTNPPKGDSKRHSDRGGDAALWWTVTCSWMQ